jgi:hypothetical protein
VCARWHWLQLQAEERQREKEISGMRRTSSSKVERLIGPIDEREREVQICDENVQVSKSKVMFVGRGNHAGQIIAQVYSISQHCFARAPRLFTVGRESIAYYIA